MTALIALIRQAAADPANFLKAHAGLLASLAAAGLAIFPPHTVGWQVASGVAALCSWPAIAKTRNRPKRHGLPRRRSTRPAV